MIIGNNKLSIILLSLTSFLPVQILGKTPEIKDFSNAPVSEISIVPSNDPIDPPVEKSLSTPTEGEMPIDDGDRNKNYNYGLESNSIMVQGYVLDSVTHEPVEFTNIAVKGTSIGTTTDENGHFNLHVRPGTRVTITCLGYQDAEFVASAKKRNLRIKLVPSDIQLTEVIVKRKRERYKRKDNPAVALAKNIIAHKHDHEPEDMHEYFTQTRYDNMSYALNNFNENHQQRWRKRFKFIDRYIDTLSLTGKPILPISIDENIETVYYRKEGKKKRTVTEAVHHAGMDQMMPNDITELLKKDVFPEINLYDENIYLFNQKFLSPLSDLGPTFYKYYLRDTLQFENGVKYIDLGFAPLLAQSYGFVGHLYVSVDSTYFVYKAVLNFPPDISMNYARNFHAELQMKRLPDSTRVTVTKLMDVDLNNTSEGLGLHASHTYYYSGFNTEEPEQDEQIFAQAPTSESPNIGSRSADMAYWSAYRYNSDYDADRSVESMLAEMRKVPLYKHLENGLTYLFKGYVPLDAEREENAHVLFGRVNSIISYHSLEGLRLRGGGMTTGNISHYVFGRGYAAYGFKDHRWKYNADLEFSFRRKKMFAEEFPIHSLRLHSSYESNELGSVMVSNRDNFINSARRSTDPKYTYVRDNSLIYTLEFWNHFSVELKAEMMREYSSRLGAFKQVGTGELIDHYDLTFGQVSLRWAPKEIFAQSHTGRIRMDFLHPVFELTHRSAAKGTLGSDFNYQATDFMFSKRFWMSPIGFTDVTLRAGRIWTQVPYTLLGIPRINTGFYLMDDCFTQLNSMEFVYDEWATWNLAYNMNGLICNNIPFLRKLKWKEVITFRGFYGSLSNQNDPAALREDGSLRNPDLYEFPTNGTVYSPSNTPYMEVAIGLDNVFRVLRIDYIRRLTYLNHPNIAKNGVQMVVSLTF